jgi:hypothetical protein
MGQLFDWEGLLGHKRPTGMMSILEALAFHCHYEAEGGALSLSGPLSGGRAQGVLCVERPLLTSAIMKLVFRKSGAFLHAFLECAPTTGASLFVRDLATYAP